MKSFFVCALLGTVLSLCGAERVVVNIRSGCNAVFYDVCGRKVAEEKISAGVQKLNIPVSGECIFTK